MTRTKRSQTANILSHFIGVSQLTVMVQNSRGEEKEFFVEKLRELEQLVSAMPKVYEQDGKGDEAVIYLHYFMGGMDWYITERDTSAAQYQAFGLADLGMGYPEMGYISIHEIIRGGAELDLHWTPKTLGEVKAERA